VGDELIDLNEAARVQEKIHALTRRELPDLVLALAPSGAATVDGLLLGPIEALK